MNIKGDCLVFDYVIILPISGCVFSSISPTHTGRYKIFFFEDTWQRSRWSGDLQALMNLYENRFLAAQPRIPINLIYNMVLIRRVSMGGQSFDVHRRLRSALVLIYCL